MDTVSDRDWFKPAPLWRRLLPWVAALLVLCLAAALFLSPYFALGEFKLAAKRGDEARIEQLADFPRLRASLKAQIAAAIKGRESRGFASAVLLSDDFMDALLTPHNLLAFIDGARLNPEPAAPLPDPRPGSAPSPAAPGAPAGPPSELEAPAPAPADPVVVSGGYTGLNRFDISVGRHSEGRPMVFSFRRSGMFGWVLDDIRLSETALRSVARD
jgi:hypothetical protein